MRRGWQSAKPLIPFTLDGTLVSDNRLRRLVSASSEWQNILRRESQSPNPGNSVYARPYATGNGRRRVMWIRASSSTSRVIDTSESLDIILAQDVDSRNRKTTGDSTRGSVGDSVFQGSPPRGITLCTFGVLNILGQKWRVGSTPIRPILKENSEFCGQNILILPLEDLPEGRSFCFPHFCFWVASHGKIKIRETF
jgi:hypothetical protein